MRGKRWVVGGLLLARVASRDNARWVFEAAGWLSANWEVVADVVVAIGFLARLGGDGVGGALTVTGLYFLASYALLRDIFPARVFSRFETTWQRWVFMASVGGAIFLTYTIIAATLALLGGTGTGSGVSEIVTVWMASMGVFTLVPLWLGVVVSIPSGGPLSPPREQTALLRGFLYSPWQDYLEGYTASSWLLHWWGVGYLFMLPVVFVALVFRLLDAFYPLFELLIVAAFCLSVVVPSVDVREAVRQVNYEGRIATVASAAVINLKGAVTAVAVIMGLGIGVYVFVDSYPLVHVPIPGWWPVRVVSRLGVWVAVLQYPVVVGGVWLRIADRIPYYLSDWTSRSLITSRPAPTPPARPRPDRFALSLVLPTALIIGARTVLFHGYRHPRIYLAWAVCWPILVGLILVRVSRSPPRWLQSDNAYIFLQLELQVVTVFYLVQYPVAVVAQRVRPPTVGTFADPVLLLVVPALLVALPYWLPELLDAVRSTYGPREAADDSATGGVTMQEHRVLLALAFGATGVLVPAVYLTLGLPFGAMETYLLLSILYFLVVSQIADFDERAPSESLPRREYLWAAVWMLGAAVTAYVALARGASWSTGLLIAGVALGLVTAINADDLGWPPTRE